MDELSFNPNAPAFGKGRVAPGEPVYWRLHPDRSAPLSEKSVEGGTEIDLLDVSGDFVLARAGGLAGWLTRERVSLPTTIVRTYKAGNQEDAARKFQIEAAEWAQRGYYPTSQSWAQGSYGCGAFLVALLLCFVLIGILVFIYMLVVKPEGTLTVTYEFRAPHLSTAQNEERDRGIAQVSAQSRPTKRCPQCAEDVLAEARICRYCRYEFHQADESVSNTSPPSD